MTPVELSRTVRHAVQCAVDQGELSVAVPERIVVGRPGPGGRGDYATGVALQLARPAGRPARQVAEVLRQRLLTAPGIAGIEITGPGFLNIVLDGRQQLTALVAEILRSGAAYGHVVGRPGVQEPPGDTGRTAADPPEAQAPAQAQAPAAGPVLLRVAPEVRAAVVADCVAALLRSQGAAVRLRYEDPGGPDPAWAALGVTVPPVPVEDPDAPRGPASRPAPRERPAGARDGVLVRPVPAPADPLPLGRVAGRWALLWPAAHDRPRIGTEHLVQREENPLFRVRYAHARTRALLRNAADLGFTPVPGDPGESATAPAGPTLTDLAAALADYPGVLVTAARRRAPDRLARCLVRTADALLRYQEAVHVLPVGDEKPSAAHRARLALVEATGTVLAGGLTLLGIDAPDHI